MRNKKITEELKIEFVTKSDLLSQLEKFVANLGGYIDKYGKASSIYHGEITINYMMDVKNTPIQKISDEE
jgi:hypothetical protein